MLPLMLYCWGKRQWFHIPTRQSRSVISPGSSWFHSPLWILAFCIWYFLSKFICSTVNNKPMLFYSQYSQFCCCYLIWSSLLWPNWLRYPTAWNCFSTVCKIEQLLTEILHFSRPPLHLESSLCETARKHSWVKKLAFLPSSDKMGNWKSEHGDSRALAQASFRPLRGFLPHQPAGKVMSLQVYKQCYWHPITLLLHTE